MEEPIKFTPEEMESVKLFQQGYQEKVMEFGKLELEKIAIEQRQTQINELSNRLRQEIGELQTREKKFTDEMSAKYGNGKLNPSTGEFTPEIQVSQ